MGDNYPHARHLLIKVIENLKKEIDMEQQRADKNEDDYCKLGERLTKENDELKKERHANFKEWMMMGLKLKAENDELKKKLNLTQD